MKLFKWNLDKLPKFPNVIEKFWGKNIDDEKEKNEAIATVPSANISDEEKAFEIALALPGMDKKDINIEINNDCLVITSQKQYEHEEKHKNWIRKEYAYTSFRRSFELPYDADYSKINANLKDGILNIAIAKKEVKSPIVKQIAIQ